MKHALASSHPQVIITITDATLWLVALIFEFMQLTTSRVWDHIVLKRAIDPDDFYATLLVSGCMVLLCGAAVTASLTH